MAGNEPDAGPPKMSTPLNLMFENLFKFDPILSGIAQMGAIKEEQGGGNDKNRVDHKQFSKNKSFKRYYSNPSTSGGTLPSRPPRVPVRPSSLNLDGVSGRVERSGSTKSYVKNRSPLSRFWQMRRKSFSHFELAFPSPHAKCDVELGPKLVLDFDPGCSGMSGYFNPLHEDHWENQTDQKFGLGHIYSTLPKSRSSNTLCDNSQRVSSNSSDDYGFLRPRERSKSLVESNALVFDLDEKYQERRGNQQHLHPTVSDFDEDDDDENVNGKTFLRRNEAQSFGGSRKSNLKRRKACYREKNSEGRSRSLTQIHNLDSTLSGMSDINKHQEMDCKSEPGHPNDQILLVPPPSEAAQKSPLQLSKRGKNRFFSASTEEANYGPTNSNLSPAGPNSNSQDVSQNNSTNSPTAPGTAAAKKRSLLSLSSPKYYQRQSRNPSGLISHEGSLKVKNTKQHRWSSLFTTSVKESSKMDGLSDHLDNYEKYGIPRPNLILCDNDELEPINSLEDDWRSIVENSDDMSYRLKQQQSAIWELVESEVLYLKTLELLTDLFLACLYNLQSANILNEIDRDKIFSNIPDIYKANKTLWLECIYPMVQKARDTRKPFQPSELHSGFLQFGAISKPYIQYCLEQPLAQEYCRSNDQRNPLFKVYLAWCEAQAECNRERLTDILVRPLQRMTKYSLLLGAILKYTDNPDERLCLEEMIMSVERFVMSVNAALRNQQESERLQGIMDKMEVYDVVDTKDEELELVVKSHSRLNLFEPMPGCGSVKRWLIFESDMRLRDSFTSKIDVHCYLFTDMLLICKSTSRHKLKVIRQPYMVDKLVTREYNKDPCSFGLVYLNEYGTAVAALALHGRDNKLVKQWLEQIKKAAKLYFEAKAKENLEFPLPETLIGESDVGLELEDEDNSVGLIYLPPHSPGQIALSSRGSQMSSLLHSHSGSIEMNETSLISSRARSFEQELRGSSLSSEEGGPNGDPSSTGATGNLSSTRSLSVETGGPLRPPSPRHDRRRLFISKSPTPNSLSIQIPVPNILGQSLPNLNTSPPQPISLTVPKSTLSPTHRGVSYPPPSPRGLRRSQALHPVNPPLMKSKHIGGSPERATAISTSAVEIKDPIPPSNDASPMSQPPEDCFIRRSSSSPKSPTLHRKAMLPCTNEDSVQILHSNPDTGVSSISMAEDSSGTGIMGRRLARNDRPDTKRYYTAGAIEDIKKENTKDSAIQKRLSWNHGPGSQVHSEPGKLASEVEKKFFSSESMSSIRSSSGVSSTSSLSYCNSDLEAAKDASGEVLASASPMYPRGSRQLPDVLIAEPDGRERSIMEQSSQPLYTSPVSPRKQQLVSLKSLNTEIETFPSASEDEEFDSLAYQRATGSMKIRRNKVEIPSKSFTYEDGMNTNRVERKDDGGNKKPKDLLNLLLTDGSLESSDV